jgi:hypothetical protein
VGNSNSTAKNLSTKGPRVLLLDKELIWAAGFFDGEGCTTVNTAKPKLRSQNPNRPYKALRLSVAQVELEPLIRFYSALKIGKIRGPYQYATNKQPHFQWNASGLDVIEVVDKLWPYLSLVKQKQALDKIDEYCDYLEKYPPRVNQFDSRGYNV